MDRDIILIDKPRGISSFDAIRILRKKLNIRKMGHAGTLDPQATGLLIIGIGSGTKKLKKITGLPKTYRATILIGKRTDTGDLEGKIVEEKPVEKIKTQDIRTLLKNLEGAITLPVPIYSATKVEGIPLYKRARRGETDITPPVKPSIIHSATFLGLQKKGETYEINTEFHVSKGTYLRSIAEEIGRRLGYPATLSALRRTAIGPYSVEDAHALDPENLYVP